MLGQLGDATQDVWAERSRRPSPVCLFERMLLLSVVLVLRSTSLQFGWVLLIEDKIEKILDSWFKHQTSRSARMYRLRMLRTISLLRGELVFSKGLL